MIISLRRDKTSGMRMSVSIVAEEATLTERPATAPKLKPFRLGGTRSDATNSCRASHILTPRRGRIAWCERRAKTRRKPCAGSYWSSKPIVSALS